MRKGQVEMIGLVIVVVLLVIGALLYVKFGVLDRKEPKTDTSVELSYASNLLNSILNVKVCDDKTGVDEGLIMCFKGQNLCSQQACPYLKNEIKTIMASVGLKDEKHYSIWIENKGKTEYLFNNCKTGLVVDTKKTDTDRSAYKINLQLC